MIEILHDEEELKKRGNGGVVDEIFEKAEKKICTMEKKPHCKNYKHGIRIWAETGGID